MASWLACALIFLFSFCSLAYELLLAKILGDLSQNEILAQSLGIGLFLLGLGAGTGLCSLWKSTRPLERLFHVEAFLTSVVFVAGLAAYAVGFSNLLLGLETPFRLFLIVGSLIFIVGFLSGFEFPLLMQSGRNGTSYHRALGFSYFGGLVAGFGVPLFLNPGWGPWFSIQLLGLLNLTLAALLLPFFGGGRALKARFLGLLLIPSASFCAGAFWTQDFEQAYLKASYFQLRIPEWDVNGFRTIWTGLRQIPDVERIHSAYQKIDFVRTSSRSAWAMDPLDGLTLYLDRRLQFNESTLRIYHESMVYGAFNLAKRTPSRALVLGGGDGLLTAELLKHPGIERIDLVELDPEMIRLAREHRDLTRLNRRALEDPKVHVHVGDAYAFMKKQAEASFDAVFIDFPYPHSPDLLRLYSVEFYRIVRRTLSPSAFVIMDGPIYTEAEMAERNLSVKPHGIIERTIRAAGFLSVFAFGPFEGFYFFTADERSLAFDYAAIPNSISNPALVNLKSLAPAFEGIEKDQGPVNSIFRPVPIMAPEL